MIEYLILFVIIPIIVASIIIPIKVNAARYINFVKENSIAIQRISELNEKYIFYSIDNLNEDHIYDNENNFGFISNEDYLIYQLQFKKSLFIKQISLVNFNKDTYEKYLKEINDISNLNHFKAQTGKLNFDKLVLIERQLIKNIIKKPCIKFEVTIRLFLSKINGQIYRSKIETFDADYVLMLIRRLNNKNGTFYSDRGIWDAICRVERGRVSNKMRFAIYKRDGYRCKCCGKYDDGTNLEIDHIKPIAKGGKSTMDNLQTLCKRCNKEKGTDNIRY